LKKVILIDNYDSFTYNLLHYIEGILGYKITVKRNDEVKLNEIDEYDYIVFSPGPGLPEEAGLMKTIIKHYGNTKKMLGVCLGMQAIAEVFEGELINLKKPFHGVATAITCDNNDPLYNQLPKNFKVGRYHSWAINPIKKPKGLKITSESKEGVIMSFTHENLPIYGVQYHPESILTEYGKDIIANFLAI